MTQFLPASVRSPHAPSQKSAFSFVSACRDGLVLVAMLLILFLARREILVDPPYQDQCYSWDEAIFLAESGFDYHKLRYEEASSYNDFNGRRAYLISVMPTLWAICLRQAGSPEQALGLAHAINLGFAALSAFVIYRLLRTSLGDMVALLVSAFYLSIPAVLVQVDMIGLYMPFIALMLMSLDACRAERPMAASLIALSAFFVKSMGLILTIGMLMYGGVAWLFASRVPSDGARSLATHRSLLMNAGCLLVELAFLFWGDSPSHSRFTTPELAWMSPWYLCKLSPDLAVLAFLGVALPIWPSRASRSSSESACPWMLAWLWASLFFMALWAVPCLPRYVTVLLALGVPTLVFGIHRLGVGRVALALLLLAGVGLNLFNREGRLYVHVEESFGEVLRTLPMFDARHCVFTERSLEYVRDHHRVRDGWKKLERDLEGSVVVAPEPYHRMLRSPWMGFVDRPFETVASSVILESLDGLMHLRDRKVIFMQSREARYLRPSVSRGDVILHDDGGDPPILYIQWKLPAEDATKPEIERWYRLRTEQE